MKRYLLILFILLTKISSAQLFIITNEKFKFETGIEPGIVAIFTNERITFDKNYYFTGELSPYVGYFPIKNLNLSAGIKGHYAFMKSDLIALPPLYGIGVYTKYILPKTINYKFFKNFLFFTEISFLQVNYVYDKEMPLYEFDQFSFYYPDKASSMEYSLLGINVGTQIHLKKGFNINVYGQYVNFIQGDQKILPRFSFSYTFKEKDKNSIVEESPDPLIEEKQIAKVKEPNTHFLNSFVVGSSLTYLWFSNTDDYPPGEHFYNEYTWNLNVATSLNKRIMVGAQLMNLFTSGSHVEDSHYMIYGVYGQYDFLAKSNTNTSLFLEMSINRGDYGTCGHLDPYRINGLWYHGMGGGLEFPLRGISERLYLECSFQNYMILNRIKTKYNYTQYILGLNYRFGKPKK